MKPSKPKKNIVKGEIVRMSGEGDLEVNLEELSGEELKRHVQILAAKVRAKELELANLQITEAQERLMSRHRTLLVDKYVREIAALDRITPGGLKSVAPSDDDDPELVDEAWRIYVHMQRGGGSRFG
jgi:hypothetical protein